MVRPSSRTVKGGTLSSRRYLPTYLFSAVCACCILFVVSFAPWLFCVRGFCVVWLCGALLCFGCGSSVHPACSRASRVCGVPCAPWAGPCFWHLVLCLGCGPQGSSRACLVDKLWCAVTRLFLSLSVRLSAFQSPWCLPLPEAHVPGFAGRLQGAHGGWPGTELMMLAAGPCRGGGAGLAPRRNRSRSGCGVVPGCSLRRRSWAECAAVVLRVLTRSHTRPVLRTIRFLTGESAGAPGLFCLDAVASHLESEDATTGSGSVCLLLCSPVCVWLHSPVRAASWSGRAGRHPMCVWLHSPVRGASWPGRTGRPPGRVLVRLTVRVAILFSFRPPPQAWCAPVFSFLFFFLLSSRASLVSAFLLFQALGALRLGPFLLPRPPCSFPFFSAPPSSPPFRCVRPLVRWASALCGCPPPFFCCFSCAHTGCVHAR